MDQAVIVGPIRCRNSQLLATNEVRLFAECLHHCMSHLFYHPSLIQSVFASMVAYPKLTARSLSNAMAVHSSDPLLRTRCNVSQASVVVQASTVKTSDRLVTLTTGEICS